MTRVKTLVTSLAALALIATLPGTAEARFGKRNSDDDSSSSSNHSSRSSNSSSSSSSSSSEHKAVPAYTPSTSSAPEHDARPAYRDSGHYHPSRPVYVAPHSHDHYVHYGWGFGYYPYVAAPQPAARVADAQVAEPAAVTATLGVDAYAHSLGATLGVGMAVEGERFGINGQFASIFYVAENGAGLDPESTNVFDLHLSYAILSGTHGRLRLEGGINGVTAPDLSVLGPDVGTSLAIGLVGPVGAEASAHATVWPHRRYDWNAGLTLALGHVGLRAGWKQLRLDDAGLTEEGVRYVDDFNGPYFGVGFAF